MWYFYIDVYTEDMYASTYKKSKVSLFNHSANKEDTYLGCANTLADAVDVVRDYVDLFDDNECVDCIHERDGYCHTSCDNLQKLGGFDRATIEELLLKCFSGDKVVW